MAVLFETHEASEISKLPTSAKICGINSRRFMAAKGSSTGLKYFLSRYVFSKLSGRDLSIDLRHFEGARNLPTGALKVAESGISPGIAARLRDELGFHSLLVGTSITKSGGRSRRRPRRIRKALAA